MIRTLWAKCLKSLEAGIGIEPIYMDLQALIKSSRANGLRKITYQKNTRPKREPDTGMTPRFGRLCHG